MAEKSVWIVVETEEKVEVEVEVDPTIEVHRSGGSVEDLLPREIFESTQVVARRKRISLEAKALKTQMQEMISVIDELFNQATVQTGLSLNEVELSVEIDVEGQISIVGNGGKVGHKGGISLRFTRPSR